MPNSPSLFSSKIKIYSDGADKKSMLEMAANPAISGLTTNPSLMKKAGITDYKTFCLDILQTIKDKPISFEVFSDEFSEMKRQAQEIKSWGKNVYVKIPIMNSRGESSIPLIKELSQSGVKLNVTAIFTMEQTLETCYAVKGGAPSIVSIFAGRIADSGRNPIPLMQGASLICKTLDPNIELLWASTREVYNIVEAELAGCHIITVPPDIIKKMSGFNKDLKSLSLDTVKTFKSDSEAAGFSL
jgi:transaldolase